MHISEGLLKPEIIIPAGVLAAGVAGYLLYKLKPEQIARTACMSALFFVGSFIHIPLGITSIHLMLSGLVGAFAGKNAFLAILIALIFQGAFFGFGGLSVLGVNALMIGIPAILGSYFATHFGKIGWFLTGAVPIFISAIILSAILLINGEEFATLAGVAMLANIALMVVEGLISLFGISYIKKVNPEILK